MIKLLRANLARVSKSATFWICFLLFTLYSILFPIITHSTFDEEYIASTGANEMLSRGYGLLGCPIIGILIAVMCCIIFGLDFHNGTIRNKLLAGHSKAQIYTANLLTISIIALAMSAVYMLFFLTITMPLFGKFTVPARDVFVLILDGTLMILAFCSIYTFVTMTSKNTLIALFVAVVLFVIGMLVADLFLEFSNEEPFYVKQYVNEYGELVEEVFENLDMPSKPTLNFVQFLADLLPSGQSFQLSNEYINNNAYRWQMSLYSIGLIVATSSAGIAIFKKSSIK